MIPKRHLIPNEVPALSRDLARKPAANYDVSVEYELFDLRICEYHRLTLL